MNPQQQPTPPAPTTIDTASQTYKRDGKTIDVKTGQPVPDPRTFAEQANTEAAAIYEETREQDIDLRESSKIIRTLAENLSSKEAPAAPPSLADMFRTEREKLGLEPLDGRLAEIDSEIERVRVGAFGEADKASERFASRNSIGQEQNKIARDADRAIALLQVERSALARQI